MCLLGNLITIFFQVFPPVLKELPPPPLELFDLEEAFSSERTRLAQAANKFLSSSVPSIDVEADMELFSLECLQALGMPTTDAKLRLHELAKEMCQFKKTSVSPP